MHQVLAVQVGYRRDHLQEKIAGLALGESTHLDYLIEKLTALADLHWKVDVLHVFVGFVQFHYVRVIDLLHDTYFTG